MSQQEWVCCKHQFSCTTDTIPVPALPPALTWTALSVPWRARFAASLRRNNIISRCSYSVVGAYRLIETGEGPLVSISVGFPGSVFPIQSRGPRGAGGRRKRASPRGDGAAGLYKSVPEQIVSVMSSARFWRAVSPCVPDCKAPSAACIPRRSGASRSAGGRSASAALTRVRMIRSRTCPPSNRPCAALIQRLPRLPPPPFSLSFSPTSVRAGRLRPLFWVRLRVQCRLAFVLRLEQRCPFQWGNCSRPGRC